MINFFDNLCGCFSPDLKKNIIDYLSSGNLNRQLIEQEKCSQQNQAPEQSIYAQVKTKSYYFMKLKEEQENPKQSQKSNALSQAYDESLEPNYYPSEALTNDDNYDQIYTKKLATLQKILNQEIDQQYSKIYDSQDQLNLKIYCKPQIYQAKRLNVYRFSFDILHSEKSTLKPKNYVKINILKNHQLLLNKKQLISKTKQNLELSHRFYKKILVIQQHDFYTAEKCQLLQQENKQVAYNVIFSVRPNENQQVPDHNRGWIYLAGLRSSVQHTEEENSTSLRESESHLHFEGYINVDLDITVNANMLKQPIAKQIRVYVQKLVCSLTETDAI